MDRFHRHEKEAIFTAGAKAVSLMFIVGMVALLAAHTTEMPGVGTMASASAVLLEPTREIPVVRMDTSSRGRNPRRPPPECRTNRRSRRFESASTPSRRHSPNSPTASSRCSMRWWNC